MKIDQYVSLKVKLRNPNGTIQTTWTDYSEGTLSINIDRGVPDYAGMWSQVDIGKAIIRSRNIQVDPAVNSQIGYGCPLRVEASGVPIFTGAIYEMNVDYVPRDTQIITITAMDSLAELGLVKIYNVEQTGQDNVKRTNAIPTNLANLLRDAGVGTNKPPRVKAADGYWSVGSSGGVPYRKVNISPYNQPLSETNNYGRTIATYYPYNMPDSVYSIAYPTTPAYTYGATQNNANFTGQTLSAWQVANNYDTVTKYSLRGVTDTNDPFYSYNNNYPTGESNSQPQPASTRGLWKGCITDGSEDTMTNFYLTEQSEKGFAFVDAKNRVILISELFLEWGGRTSIPIKASFKSDGTGLSYDSVSVTDGSERIVNDLIIQNVWNNNVLRIWDINKWTIPNSSSLYYNLSIGSKTQPPFDAWTQSWEASSMTKRNFTYSDATSIAKYGTKTLVLNTNYGWTFGSCNASGVITNPNFDNVKYHCDLLGSEIMAAYSTPTREIKTLTVSPRPDSIPSIKGIDIYDRINIDHQDNSVSFDNDYTIVGIHHRITPNSWTVDYELWNEEGYI